MRIPTVKIRAKTESGFVIVNESDFDPATMERWIAPEKKRQREENPKRRSRGRPRKDG